jgi:hypothetical protein
MIASGLEVAEDRVVRSVGRPPSGMPTCIVVHIGKYNLLIVFPSNRIIATLEEEM